MGEIDVIKSTLLLPGVQSVGEGASGFNVRGGNADQNLILINQAPVFNPSHLFGFFSVFNPDVIKSFDLYKGGIPARYGGRLSSVLDIAMKDGNKRELVGSGGISPLTARFTVEGPIQKNRSSFILGGRSTYSDWILRRLPDPNLRNSKAGFYDLNGKINLDLGIRIVWMFRAISAGIILSSMEILLIPIAISMAPSIGNICSTTNFLPHFRHFQPVQLSDCCRLFPETAFQLQYQIRYQEAKQMLLSCLSLLIRFALGINAILYALNPGSRQALSPESLVVNQSLEQEQAIESGLYVSEEWNINSSPQSLCWFAVFSLFFIGSQ